MSYGLNDISLDLDQLNLIPGRLPRDTSAPTLITCILFFHRINSSRLFEMMTVNLTEQPNYRCNKIAVIKIMITVLNCLNYTC